MPLTKRLVSKTEDENTTNDTGEAVLAWHLVDGQDKNGISTVRFLLYLRRLRAWNATGQYNKVSTTYVYSAKSILNA